MPNNMTETMPESLEAEAALLGSMIVDSKCVAEVVDFLRVEMFNRECHRILFEAIKNQYNENDGSVDAVLLRTELKARGQLEQIGGVEYIAKILDSVPTSANAQYYAKIVLAKFLERKMRQSVLNLSQQINSPLLDVKEKKAAFEQVVMELEITDNPTAQMAHIKELVQVALDEAIIISKNPTRPVALPTGFIELDKKTRGLCPGDLTILAGRPSMGKSALMLDIALALGRAEHPTAIFSMEMSPILLVERLLANTAKISLHSMKRGHLTREQWQALYCAGSGLQKLPMRIDGTATLTPASLTTKIINMKSQHDIKCAFVDYLQLMNLGKRCESRQQEITTITRQLKALAKKVGIPIVVLCQLSRAPEQRTDHRPRLSDLRESGSIEQDADVVMLLHREDYYRRMKSASADEDGKATVIIAKNRQGPTGDVNLVWLPACFSFMNIKEEDEGETLL